MTLPTPPPVPGFLRTVRTGIRDALEQSFGYSYPEQDASGGTKRSFVSLSYPRREADYPGVWLDFEVSLLQTVGLDHTEIDSSGNAVTRWRFQGYATFTVVALNDNECDAIWDQLVGLTAFAAQSDYPSAFRSAVEGNPLVSLTLATDTVDMRGSGASPGTPWGSDEVIYERGMGLKAVGEFVTVPQAQALVPLSEIIVTGQPSDIAGDPVGSPWTLTIGPDSP